MAALQELYYLLDINIMKFSKEELFVLEADLFTYICKELMEYQKGLFKDYFRLLKFTTEKERIMIETNFIRCIIQDILSTDEYTLSGIAYYTDTPEEVIHEVAAGCNANPTLFLARKIIELHRNVRPDLYRNILNKAIKESLASLN